MIELICLLAVYFLGILTGVIALAYVQAKARITDGYNPWEQKR